MEWQGGGAGLSWEEPGEAKQVQVQERITRHTEQQR